MNPLVLTSTHSFTQNILTDICIMQVEHTEIPYQTRKWVTPLALFGFKNTTTTLKAKAPLNEKQKHIKPSSLSRGRTIGIQSHNHIMQVEHTEIPYQTRKWVTPLALFGFKNTTTTLKAKAPLNEKQKHIKPSSLSRGRTIGIQSHNHKETKS